MTGGRHWLAAAAPVAIVVIAAAVIIDAGRDTTFFYDEWIWIMQRRSPGSASLLEPFNNHLMALPIATYQVLIRVFGLDSQAPYRFLLLVGHLATCGLLYVYLRRRVRWEVALAAAAALAFYGYAWAVIIWPISLGWVYATTAGITALLLVDRETRRADLGASAALLIGVASSGIAVPFVLGVTVELVMRRAWRRLYVSGIPLTLFAIWYLGYGTGTNDRGSAGQILEFAENILAQTVGTLLGIDDRGTAAHVMFAVVVVALVVLWFALGRPRSPRLVGNAVALGSFTALLSYSRATSGLTTWHSYAAAVFVLLVVGELLVGRALGWVPTVAVGVVVVWSIVWNLGQLADGSDLQRARADEMRAQLTAVELAGPAIDADQRVGRFLLETRAGPWLDVAQEYGSPAFTLEELRDASRSARRAADRLLVRGAGLALVTSVAPETCTVSRRAVVPRSSSVLVLPSPRPTRVRAGVFTAGIPVGRVDRSPMLLELPPLRQGERWTVSVEDRVGRVCTVPANL